MTGLWAAGLSTELTAFVGALGPVVAVAGTLEVVVAISRQTSDPRHSRDFPGICRRYVSWLLAGLALTVGATALSAAEHGGAL